MPGVETFTPFAVALDQYVKAVAELRDLYGYAHPNGTVLWSESRGDYSVTVKNATAAVVRTWTALDALIDPTCAVLGFDAAGPVLKLRRGWSAERILPDADGNAGVLRNETPWLQRQARQIHALLERVRVTRATVEPASSVVTVGNSGSVNPDPVAVAKPHLNETDKKAARYIRGNPGCKGESLALGIGVTSEHFRSRIFPKLRAHGYSNDDGYRPPKRVKNTAK